MQAGVPLTYYNCNNEDGITIDGVEDNHDATQDTLCHWEFVTGDAGTYVRTLDVVHDLENHPEYDPDRWFHHWFYDNATPNNETGGDDHSPLYELEPAPWSVCGALTSGQLEAWGTHGMKFDFHESILVLNTDPLRWRETHHRGELPMGACPVELLQPQLFTFELHFRQFYDEPNMPVENGQMYYDNAFNNLYRNMDTETTTTMDDTSSIATSTTKTTTTTMGDISSSTTAGGGGDTTTDGASNITKNSLFHLVTLLSSIKALI